jgi:hypothetical protein
VLRRGGIAEVDKKRAADVDSAALRQNFSSLDAAMASAVVVAGDLSQLAEQDQDQEDNDHESEPAAPVVAGPIEGTAPDPAEAT